MRTSFFNKMTVGQQSFMLEMKAVLLTIRREPDYIIALYEMDGKYVESFYHIKTRKLVKNHLFTSTDLLEPYLQQIELPDFFSVV